MNIILISIFSIISGVALILIYSMRVKRKAEKVSALFLWQGQIQTSIDRTLFKRFFKDKLFYLHAAILILLLAALLYSVIAKPFNNVRRLVLIIDVSASMKSIEAGESRLVIAKKKAFALLKNYEESEVMIISAGEPVKILLQFSRNRDETIKVIKKIEAGDTATDIQDAIFMIKPYMRETDHIYLLSDGILEGIPSLVSDTPNLYYINTGETGENAGIQSLEVYRNEENEKISAAVTIKNFGKKDILSSVDMISDEKVIDAQRIALPAGGEKTINFDNLHAAAESITARLNHEDALSSDNFRYAVSALKTDPSVLLVTRDGFFLKKLLTSLRKYSITILEPEEYESNIMSDLELDHDISIYDNYIPAVETGNASIYINPEKSTPGVVLGNDYIVPKNIRALKAHPVMEHTDFSDLNIQIARRFTSFDGLELLGSSESPLITISKQQGRDRAILGFNIKDSNFSKSVNFPVFFTNLLNQLQPDRSSREKYIINCGETISIMLPLKSGNASEAMVRYPDGKEKDIIIKDGAVIFSDTSIAGTYSLRHDDVEMKFAANVPPAESDINTAGHIRPSIKMPGISSTSFLSDFTIWKIFGIMAVILLLSEKKIREKLL